MRGVKTRGRSVNVIASGERERLLDPIDRISEILFGLIMAVTIVGSLSIATAGRDEMRTITMAALGCNLAWGLVDAVMYLIRTMSERSHNRALATRILGADEDSAYRLIAAALPEHVARIVGPAEIEGMRRRLLELQFSEHAILRPRDWLEAIGIFVLVVIATFPVVVPFLITSVGYAVSGRNRARALRGACEAAGDRDCDGCIWSGTYRCRQGIGRLMAAPPCGACNASLRCVVSPSRRVVVGRPERANTASIDLFSASTSASSAAMP